MSEKTSEIWKKVRALHDAGKADRVLFLGDVIIDEWIENGEMSETPGGMGGVIRNYRSLTGSKNFHVFFLDTPDERLRRLFDDHEELPITNFDILKTAAKKIRVYGIGDGELDNVINVDAKKFSDVQVPRTPEVSIQAALSAKLEKERAWLGTHLVAIVDYGKGFYSSKEIIREVLRWLPNAFIVVHAHKSNATGAYEGANGVVMNVNDVKRNPVAYWPDLRWVVTTAGAKGCYIQKQEEQGFRNIEPFDISEVVDDLGAGDTFFAALVACMAVGREFRPEGASAEDFLSIANTAGALQCQEDRVSAITGDQLAYVLKPRVEPVNDTVMVNGVFDLLHEGHMHLLTQAALLAKKENCTMVVRVDVGLRVRELKAKDPVIWKWRNRYEIVERFVNSLQLGINIVGGPIVSEGALTLPRFIRKARPKFWVKLRDQPIPENEMKAIHDVCTDIFWVHRRYEMSTTSLVNRFREEAQLGTVQGTFKDPEVGKT